MNPNRAPPTLPLTAIRAFEAAARLGSFKAAATELSVTPAAVSHQVKALEVHLGTPLFYRLHRALQLTDVGERLALAVHGAFLDISQAISALATDGLIVGPTTLRISAAPSFATKWLAPRLHRFQALHPSYELRIVADQSLVELKRNQEIDVALRYGAGPYGTGLDAERLWASSTVFPVCAPALAARAAFNQPADLAAQTLLRTAEPAGGKGAGQLGWNSWFNAAGVSRDALARSAAPGPLFGSTQLALEAAASGRGVALAPAVLVEEDLRTGRLVKPFDIAIPNPFWYWLIVRTDRANEARIRAFSNWIRHEAKATSAI